MRVLNPSHAKQLFCWHAFLQPSPRSGFEQIVEKFLLSCQRLPLSLKVLGGQLYGRSQMDYWEAQLEKISRILPGDITERLKISYDALDEEDKDMFLDTACFFIGEERSTAITVWDGLKWNGLHGLERLVNKCLVELVDEPDWRKHILGRITQIRMHDHLRDLGREIANRQSPYRLWSARQTIHIQPAEEICIRGIKTRGFDPDRFHPSSQGEIIVNTNKGSRSLNPFISGLKIFDGIGDFLNQNVSKGSRELVWLPCRDFKEKNLPSWLYLLESLRILELEGARNLEILWEAATTAPSQLRELVLKDCVNLKEFPRSMGHLKHLKVLHYSCFNSEEKSIRSLPEEFCSLQSLRYLELEYCANLSSLPRRFGELTNLQHLNLECCSKLSSLPSSICNLTNLQHLNLEGCSKLSSLPRSICNLTNLQHLNLTYCSNLSSLPSRFGDLTNLQHLDMGYCTKLRTLPVSFKQLTALQYLNLEGCSELTIESDILENMTRLQYLDFSKCGNMEDLRRHCIENGASLKELNLGGTRIREVPANICQLSKLEILRVGSDSLTRLPSSIGNLSSLTTFEIISCKLLTSLPTTLGNLCSLLKLKVIFCDKLECLPDSLGNLCSLPGVKFDVHLCLSNNFRVTKLKVTHCDKLASLPDSLGNLCSLQKLRVTGCDKLASLPDSLGNLCSLKTFELKGCPKVEKIEGLEYLTSLEKLSISGCPELDGLPSFAELISLKTFELKGCPKVEKIEGLEDLRSLEEFKAYTCLKVPCIISLEKARDLRKLIVVANEKSVVEHCIPTIHQKRLEEVIICTRAVCDVGSFVNSQAFPNLSVLDSTAMVKIGSEGQLELRHKGSSSITNAVLICIIIDVVSPVIDLVIGRAQSETRFEMDLGQGKWVWMGLFTRKSNWYYGGIFLKGSDENHVVERAWLITGEDEEIRQSFRRLFHTFARIQDSRMKRKKKKKKKKKKRP